MTLKNKKIQHHLRNKSQKSYCRHQLKPIFDLQIERDESRFARQPATNHANQVAKRTNRLSVFQIGDLLVVKKKLTFIIKVSLR